MRVVTRLFHVVLLDDDEHKYDYVIDMPMKILCHCLETAFRHTAEVDSRVDRFSD